MFGLQDRHVLVTGASGGVGAVAVSQFLAAGCKVTAQVNRNTDSLNDQACDALHVVRADVAVECQVSDLFAHAVAKHGPLHILILNHGVFRAADVPMHEMSMSDWNETININLTGSFLCARSFLAQLRPDMAYKPSICIVGSTAGKYGEAFHADYASSKSALQYGFTLSLKNEIVRRHPAGRVNAVAPGWIETEMARRSLADPDTRFAAMGTTPLRKIATSTDVVNSILYLSSDRLAGHVTGQCLMVEGGM